MSEQEIKPCPYCGSTDIKLHDEITHAVWCQECFAEMPSIDIESAVELWNTRPIEDELRARIAELEAESERLSQLLHDEMSQLEIATDLGNKRWAALNKIYEDGEKRNTNWCKRIAQEGLGIKNA